jgi:stage III sporulation protein SpoIIIAA
MNDRVTVPGLFPPKSDSSPDSSRDSDNELARLVGVLPLAIQESLQELDLHDLIEVVMDLGRAPEARFPQRAARLLDRSVAHEDLAHVVALIGDFTADNRAGLERTLHRVSAIRNRNGDIIGLTLRVGRAVLGTIDLIRDLVEAGRNLLLLGRPGIGKTTKLREVARVLADDLGKRVIVVDTSNEIAGDGDVPHPAIGAARRMQVPHPDRQHAVMIEAVENHMPEAIIVDEIGTEAEAIAARTIAERGVQLVGTAHGNTLDNLVMNPTLADLVGGVQTVTLGDEEARFRGTQKTIQERKRPPTFDAVVEIVSHDEVKVHGDTAAAVDSLLRGQAPAGEHRAAHGRRVEPAPMHAPAQALLYAPPHGPTYAERRGPMRIYPYALSRDLLEKVMRDLRLDARAVGRAEQADMVLALRARADDSRLARIIEATGAALHLVKKNTTAQLRLALQNALNLLEGVEDEEVNDAVKEAELAVQRVLKEGVMVELMPRRPALRKMQHRVVTRYQLVAESVGSEPARHLVIYPQ